MFNFNNLTIQKNAEGSFVGIRKNRNTNEMEFCLPNGFDDFDINYDNVKNLFFKMYKTFKIFYHNKTQYQKNKLQDNKPQTKDQIEISNHTGAYCFVDKNEEEVLLYSKLDIIDKIIEIYDELEIESIVTAVGWVDEIDYSNIDVLMKNGILLKNHAIIVERMEGKKNLIENIPSDLIEIYCYIYKELSTELGNEIDSRVNDIAYNFSYKYLTSIHSLFNEYTFESTIMILKDRLDNIDRETAYKNHMYWDIFEAIENFLYGRVDFDSEKKEGFWGINNFSSIWEDMCNTLVFQDESKKVLYCDTNLNLQRDNLVRKQFGYGNPSVLIDKDFKNNFYVQFKNKRRWMRPDLIITDECETQNRQIQSDISNYIKDNIIKIKPQKPNSPKSKSLKSSNYSIDIQKNNYMIDLITKKISYYEKVQAQRIFDDLYKELQRRSKKRGFFTTQIRNGLRINVKNISEIQLRNILKKVDLQERQKRKKEIKKYNLTCIDWKYVNKNSDKLKKGSIDSIKQLTYEFCLLNNSSISGSIKSQFVIPYFSLANNIVLEQLTETENSIEIVKLNFRKAQEVYLNEY